MEILSTSSEVPSVPSNVVPFKARATGRDASDVTISVLMPTVGRATLPAAVHSVIMAGARPFVLIDGAEHAGKVMALLQPFLPYIDVMVAPYNTHQGAFYGTRLIKAAIHLTNAAWTSFLDDDNVVSRDHFQRLIDAAGVGHIAVTRRYWVWDEVVLGEDVGHSTGTDPKELVDPQVKMSKWKPLCFADTNCWLFKTAIMSGCSWILNNPLTEASGYNFDIVLSQYWLNHQKDLVVGDTRMPTVFYRWNREPLPEWVGPQAPDDNEFYRYNPRKENDNE